MARRIFAKWAPTQGMLVVVLLAAALVPTQLHASDESGNDSSLLAFLSARGSERFDADRPSGRPAHGAAVADVLYTFSRGKLRLLAEGAVATHDAGTDRLQLGCEPVPDTLVWLGKFH